GCSVHPVKSFAGDLDIGWLSMMTIGTLAEEKFGVRSPDEEGASLTAVQDAVSFLQNAQQACPIRPGRHHGPPRPTTPEEHTMATPTVVITGLGATTPLGGHVPSAWSAALAGKAGVRTLDNDWAERYEIPVDFAGQLAVPTSDVLARTETRKMDPSAQYAVVATREAWADAGSPEVDGERLGAVVASGIGGVWTLLDAW